VSSHHTTQRTVQRLAAHKCDEGKLQLAYEASPGRLLLLLPPLLLLLLTALLLLPRWQVSLHQLLHQLRLVDVCRRQLCRAHAGHLDNTRQLAVAAPAASSTTSTRARAPGGNKPAGSAQEAARGLLHESSSAARTCRLCWRCWRWLGHRCHLPDPAAAHPAAHPAAAAAAVVC
jgi:hypothetical protein